MANIGQPLFLSKVSKLQSDGAAQPARFEESFAGGVDLQSMTSDINLYMDPAISSELRCPIWCGMDRMRDFLPVHVSCMYIIYIYNVFFTIFPVCVFHVLSLKPRFSRCKVDHLYYVDFEGPMPRVVRSCRRK